MEETIISWNVANWFTILLMVLVGYMAWQTVKRLSTRAGVGNNA